MAKVRYRASGFVTEVVGEVRLTRDGRVLVTQVGMTSILKLTDVVSINGIAAEEYFAGNGSGNGPGR